MGTLSSGCRVCRYAYLTNTILTSQFILLYNEANEQKGFVAALRDPTYRDERD